VLEEAADDGAHPDALGELGEAGAQAAQAPHREVDLDAGAGGPVERVDHAGVGEALSFMTMRPERPRLGLLLDHRHRSACARSPRHEDLAVVGVGARSR